MVQDKVCGSKPADDAVYTSPYFVADQEHGGDAAGQLVVDFLDGVRADPELARRYLPSGAGR